MVMVINSVIDFVVMMIIIVLIMKMSLSRSAESKTHFRFMSTVSQNQTHLCFHGVMVPEPWQRWESCCCCRCSYCCCWSSAQTWGRMQMELRCHLAFQQCYSCSCSVHIRLIYTFVSSWRRSLSIYSSAIRKHFQPAIHPPATRGLWLLHCTVWAGFISSQTK